MALSGTYTWAPDIATLIEEAYERCGLELKTSYQLRTAVRSLSLLLDDWVSRGINLWLIDEETVTLSVSTATYTLNTRIVDFLDASVRDGSEGTDLTLERISLDEYRQYNNKAVNGDPTTFTLEFNSTGGHTLYVYPVPTATDLSIRGWALRYPQDSDVAYTDQPEVPRKFIPALTAGLAYALAVKNPPKYELSPQGEQVQVSGVPLEIRQSLMLDYRDSFKAADLEDRDRASLYLVPDLGGY